MPTYTTEINQSLPFGITPVGQKLITAISNELCVANEQNVKFCFDISIFDSVGSAGNDLGVFKTTPNNAGVGVVDISNIVENYISADNIATSNSDFKNKAANGRPIPTHLIDKYSESANSVKLIVVKGYTEYTDSTGIVQQTNTVNVIINTIINGYVKENNLLEWTDATDVGDAFGFGFNLEPYAPIKGSSGGKFLSNSPSTLYARLGDYGTLSFLALHNFGDSSSFIVSVIYYKVTMYNSSGVSLGNFDVQKTENNGAFNGTANVSRLSSRILYIGAFPANLRVKDDFNDQINDMSYYTIGLYDDSDTLISEVKRVDILCPNLKGYERVRLTWLNQFGTWDYFTFNQKSVKKISTKGTTYQQLGGTWNSTHYDPYGYKGGKKTFRVNASETIKMNTDYITEEHSEWFEELVNSPEIYILKQWESPRQQNTFNLSGSIMNTFNQYLTPCTLTTKSLTKKTVANDRLIQYTFEVEKSRNLRTQAI